VAAAAVVALAGCGGMPSGGVVHVGRALPAAGGLSDVDVHSLPPPWQPGLAPKDVVDGFLRALVNDDDDYSIARSYLTTSAAAKWRPAAGVTTYEDDALRTEQTAASTTAHTITVTAPRIGQIDAHGDYAAAPGTLTASYALVREGTGWRIARLPDGVLLSALDVPRFFRTADLYFLNSTGTSLVPEQVLVQNSPRGAATALISLLLAGPGRALAPAVHSAAPPGTSLVGNVPVDAAGVADVNVSNGLRLVSRRTLSAFSAQLVWTLRQVSGVTAVRLLVDGAPVPVGASARQPVRAWPQFDPAPRPASPSLLWVSGGRPHGSGDGAPALHSALVPVLSVARSGDGHTVAAVQGTRAGMRLVTGRAGAPLRARLTATTVTTPTFDAMGDVVVVTTSAGRRRVVAVTPSGAVRDVPADTSILRSAVTELRLSHDGARAAVVDGAGRLLVGLAETQRGQLALSGFRVVAPALQAVAGLSWSGADSIVVTAAGPGGRQVVETDSDGYSLRTIPTDGVHGQPVAVAAAPGLPLVIRTADGRMWAELGTWHRLSTGNAPVYSG